MPRAWLRCIVARNLRPNSRQGVTVTDEQKRIVDEFSRDLHDAYGRSGIASFSELKRRLDAPTKKAGPGGPGITNLSRTAAWTTLKGKRKQLPAWDQVALLLRVFRAAAAERNIDPSRVGTLDEWKLKHETATAAFRAAAKSPASRIPAKTAADACDAAGSAGGAQVWWSSYSDIVPARLERYLNHEPLSDLIFCYGHLDIPGLLQTPEYAAEFFRLRYGHEPRERLARRVQLRMHRQRHLNRRKGRPHMWAVLNEGALRSDVVSTATMRAQVRHLLELERHVCIQIIPASDPAHDSADGPITILRFESLQLQDLVYLDHADGPLYPSDEKDVGHYLHAFHKLGLAALKPEPSKTFMRSIETEIQ
ncbi:hypothetical protein E1264_04865 [Actinomadura sp. KC216]|uniref:DUF5753 domain-containing protein n=1 Tax=Actinomadura sp. KC216 TaxID=2530370 RepID=UPI001042FB1E|nr:DUF5753 domain-containing protein [Actinomadura sp. KC216]TDB90457.1 hypothetical protein E1264_04865 [Actinomadura sp. KC216]